MPEFFRFEVYDMASDELGHFWDCVDDATARAEFSAWLHLVVPDWEHRELGRYFLLQTGTINGDGLFVGRPEFRGVMADWEVRLSFVYFSMSDPPSNDDEVAALLSEFNRLDAIDGERLADFANLPGVGSIGS